MVNQSNSIRPHVLILNFDRVFTALQVTLQDALASLDLGPAQWDTLRLIRDNPGVSGAEIARRLLVTPSAVATMLQRLENAGYIKRQASARGRVIEAHLTEQGGEVLAAGDDIAESVENALFDGFTPSERQQFYTYMQRFMVNLEPFVNVTESQREHPRPKVSRP